MLSLLWISAAKTEIEAVSENDPFDLYNKQQRLTESTMTTLTRKLFIDSIIFVMFEIGIMQTKIQIFAVVCAVPPNIIGAAIERAKKKN